MNASQTLVETYRSAKHAVRAAGYCHETVNTQESFESFSESDLLRETAWVILSSGFRESVVRRCFSYVSLCYSDWCSADLIVQHQEICIATAMLKLNHLPKLRAIVTAAQIIQVTGFSKVKTQILNDPIGRLQDIPFIGPITVYHLAKNLGACIAKPDRHLQRIAKAVGFDDVQQFCRLMSDATGDSVATVDTVLWRYATLDRRYADKFALAAAGSGTQTQ